jgi:hypothetical protein
MEDEPCKQANLHDAHQDIGTHEVSGLIEILLAVGKEDIGVDVAVDDQEHDQENPGKRHGYLFPDG